MVEASKPYSQCRGTTASQLALFSDEIAAAIFKAAISYARINARRSQV